MTHEYVENLLPCLGGKEKQRETLTFLMEGWQPELYFCENISSHQIHACCEKPGEEISSFLCYFLSYMHPNLYNC